MSGWTRRCSWGKIPPHEPTRKTTASPRSQAEEATQQKQQRCRFSAGWRFTWRCVLLIFVVYVLVSQRAHHSPVRSRSQRSCIRRPRDAGKHSRLRRIFSARPARPNPSSWPAYGRDREQGAHDLRHYPLTATNPHAWNRRALCRSPRPAGPILGKCTNFCFVNQRSGHSCRMWKASSIPTPKRWNSISNDCKRIWRAMK